MSVASLAHRSGPRLCKTQALLLPRLCGGFSPNASHTVAHICSGGCVHQQGVQMGRVARPCVPPRGQGCPYNREPGASRIAVPV